VRYFVFLFFWLTIYLHAFSQTSSIQFRHLTISNGLSSNEINAICQDKEGFLWFGTQSGLNRFDGKHFRTFLHSYSDSNSIASNICLGLCVDSADNIWVRSAYSVSCFDKHTGKFINYFVKDKSGKRIVNHEILSTITIQKNGNILAYSPLFGFLESDSTKKELIPKHFRNIPSSVDNKSMFLHSKGVIGFITDSAIYVSKDDGEHFSVALKSSDLPDGENTTMLGLVNVSGNDFWFADFRGDVNNFIIEANLITHHINAFRFPFHYFMDLSNYDENTCWMGYWGSGLTWFNKQSGQFLQYANYKSDAGSLSSNLIKTLFIDKDQILWIGTPESGIDYCNPGRDNVVMVNNTKKGYEKMDISEIETMAEDISGKIWIGLLNYNAGATNGLVSYDPKTASYKSYTTTGSGLYGIWRILPENDHLLLSTQNGLAAFDLRTKTILKKLKENFPPDILNFQKGFTVLQKDLLGNYWLGAWREGLLKFNAVTNEAIYFNTHSKEKSKRLSDDLVGQLAVDENNNIWVINLMNNVLDFINNKTNRVTHIPIEVNGQAFTDKLHCIIADRSGHIWIGSNGGGLIRYNDTLHEFKLYSIKNGLPDLFVRSMRIDDKNRLWVLTATGLVWIDLGENEIHNVDRNIVQLSGVNGDDPFLFTKEGYLFAGNAHGFIYFKPADVMLSESISLPVPTLLQKMWHEMYIPPAEKEIKVLPGEDNVSVSFVSPDMLHGNEINYAYRLKGYEDNWQDVGNEGIAKFTKLPPGQYDLQMRATFRGTVWDGRYSSLFITVFPPFYQTWWFRLVSILLIAIIATWAIYTAATKRLHKKLAILKQQQQINDLRNRIASDIHDEIGAGLTRISIRSELAKQNKEASKKDFLDVLQNINRQSHELVNNLGEIVWTINPHQDKLDSMFAYFRHYIHQFMQGLPLNYTIHFSDVIPDIMVHPDIKRNLFLILKESINNAVKHAHANKLTISIELTGHHYQMKVVDDGVGIYTGDSEQFGNGIRGMKNRAAMIHAAITIQSQAGIGSEVMINGTLYASS